jgi:hypothetical protein
MAINKENYFRKLIKYNIEKVKLIFYKNFRYTHYLKQFRSI